LLSTESTICPGASSIEAVIIMQQRSRRKAGRSAVRSISPVEIPEAARSVSGNFWPKSRTP
jgi:hypothetical protein